MNLKTEQYEEELQTLRKSQFFFKAVADFTYDWEYWVDPEGNVIYNSPSCLRITGYEPDAFLKDSTLLTAIIHPSDLLTFKDHTGSEQELNKDEILSITYRIQKLDGETRWIEHICQPVFDQDGQWLGRRVSNRDITERKKLDDRAQKQTLVVEAINRIFRGALLGKTIEELAKTCLEMAEKLTESKCGSIGELNPLGLFNTLAITNPGWDACKIARKEAAVVLSNMEIDGVSRSAIRDGKSRIVNDIPSHPDFRGFPEGHPVLSCYLGVPLIDAGKPIGMIGLANKDGGYTIEDQEAIETLSYAIVEALKQKKLEIKLERQNQEIIELSTPIMRMWEGVVVAPLIGSFDSERARQFMEVLLESVVKFNAEIALIDIRGIAAIDTQTAQYIIEAIDGVRLIGAQVVLTGVRPTIAQTLVHLGIDLSKVITRSSLSAGFRDALNLLNLKIIEGNGIQKRS